MVRLGVNIDHVATLRQARRGTFPDPLEAAKAAERGGADGIVAHLREDRRHIQDHDVEELVHSVRTKLSLEMAATREIVDCAIKYKVHGVCLVPERRAELTTEGGLNVAGKSKALEKTIKRLRDRGIFVSLFVDPDREQVQTAAQIGAQAVELHTGAYANAKGDCAKELDELKVASALALEAGLILNAGHGLDYDNVMPVAQIPGMNELNIGFSIISRAIFVGLENATREMAELIKRS